MGHFKGIAWRLAALLISGIVVIGCYDQTSLTFGAGDEDTAPGGCRTDLDCPEGYSCDADGQCVQDPYANGCSEDSDCVSGYECVIDPKTGEGICRLLVDGDVEPECVKDEDCSTGMICVQGECRIKRDCERDADCPPNFRCNQQTWQCEEVIGPVDGDFDADLELELEQEEDAFPLTCQGTANCPVGYVCSLDGICIPSCEQTGCLYGICNVESGLCEYCDPPCPDTQCCNYAFDFWYCGTCCRPPCPPNQVCQAGDCISVECPPCPPGQICGAETGFICMDIIQPDGDVEQDADPDLIPSFCRSTEDCPRGYVCNEQGKCEPSCILTGCEFGTCNTNTGECEFCDPPCPDGRCCNYNMDFWYCGSCCNPPCEDGMACQGGACIPLQCPRCPPWQQCGPETGYVCEDIWTDGDVIWGKQGKTTCLPANSSCIEGVDFCCSGTCLMGTCL